MGYWGTGIYDSDQALDVRDSLIHFGGGGDPVWISEAHQATEVAASFGISVIEFVAEVAKDLGKTTVLLAYVNSVLDAGLLNYYELSVYREFAIAVIEARTPQVIAEDGWSTKADEVERHRAEQALYNRLVAARETRELPVLPPQSNTTLFAQIDASPDQAALRVTVESGLTEAVRVGAILSFEPVQLDGTTVWLADGGMVACPLHVLKVFLDGVAAGRQSLGKPFDYTVTTVEEKDPVTTTPEL